MISIFHRLKAAALQPATLVFTLLAALPASAAPIDSGTSPVLLPGGSFETPVAGTSYRYRPTGTPWTYLTASGVAGNNSDFTRLNPSAPLGVQVLFLQYAGQAQQSVEVSGGTYRLSLKAAQRGNFNTTAQVVRVLIDGQEISRFTPASTSYESIVTAPFTVTPGVHSIAFAGLGLNPNGTAANDTTAFLDDIRLVPKTPPTITSPGNLSTLAGTAVAITIAAADLDGDPLTFAAAGLPAGLTISSTTGAITGAATQAGVYPVTIAVNDGSGPVSTSFVWTITANGGVAGSFAEDFSTAVDPARWSGGSRYVPLAGSFDPAITVAAQDGQLVITPPANVTANTYNGLISNAALDLRGSSVSLQVTPANANALTWFALGSGRDFLLIAYTAGYLYLEQSVDGANDFTAVPYVAAEHRFWRIRHDSGTDQIIFEASPDGSAWTPLRITARTIPIDAMQIELVAGAAQATTDAGSASFDDLLYTPNRAPTLAAVADQTSRIGSSVAVQITASDLDAHTLTYSATGLPDGLTIGASSGLITGTATLDAQPTNAVTVTVTDGLLSATTSFSWSVKVGVAASFTEDFSGETIDPALWNVGVGFASAFGPFDPLVETLQQEGQLSIQPRGDLEGFAFNGLVSRAPINLTGASVQARVTPAGSGLTWLALGEGSNFLFFAETGGSLFLQQLVNGEPDSVDVPYDPALHRFWRIRHDALGDRILFEASPDGVNWTLLRAVARAIPIDGLPIELNAGTNTAEPASTPAIFDDVLWQLSPPNTAPTIATPATQIVVAGQPVTLQIAASDADFNSLFFAAVDLPAGLAIDPASGLITGTPLQPGTTISTITVSDGELSDTAVFGWEVKPDIGFGPEWTSVNVGAPALGGSATFANGVSTLTGSGLMAFNADQFQYTWIPIVGDGEAVVRVTSQTGGTSARAGLVFRETAQPNSRAAGVYLTPGAGFVFQTRVTTAGGSAVRTAPRFTEPNNWLRLVRTGDTFVGYRSADGVTWSQFASATIPMSRAITFGLAVSSQTTNTSSTATFDGLNFTPSTLPTPWIGGDLGTPALTEPAQFADGVFAVNGGGVGITGTADSGHFTSQTLTGDGEIVARVAGQSSTYVWAKAGVMIRDGSAANAKMAYLTVTQGSGIYFQARTTTGGVAGTTTAPRGNQWLRLVRTGNTITASRSANGVTWTQIGTSTITFGPTVSIGLAVTASSANLLSTATFDNVTVTPATTTALP